MTEWSLPSPQDLGLNQIIGHFSGIFIFSNLDCKDGTKEKEVGNILFKYISII